LGGISFFNLPITLFPDIAPPTVVVSASYPGASAETVTRSIAAPIEESVNGVDDMTYMTSRSNSDGTMNLTVFFKQGTNSDIAAVNVQNHVNKAMSQLPQEVIQAGISTQKQMNDRVRVIAIAATDSTYDEAFLNNYLIINFIPVLQRIPGVADVSLNSNSTYAIRLWLEPDRLTAYNISPQEVLESVRRQNMEATPGRLGSNSTETYEYVLTYKGKNNREEEYGSMIIRTDDNGIIRLRDVARIEFGSSTYLTESRSKEVPVAGVAIVQNIGANANELLKEIERVTMDFERNLPPGIEVRILFDSKLFLDDSMNQLMRTLVEAFIFVFLVVFIFLQDIRSTLIPAIAVPVSIVGTFFFMQLFGFSINLLTMFALILAIGIVVDDAIIVVEAVHEKMDSEGLEPRSATIASMREIAQPIISVTLVMAAVFLPVSFMQGPTEVFYRQFALTLGFAILISGVNALTLSPMLCALFLKNKKHNNSETGSKNRFSQRFFTAFNTGFNAFTEKYLSLIRFAFRHKLVTVSGLVLVTICTLTLLYSTKTGFIPTEDRGLVDGIVILQPGSSLDKTDRVIKQIEEIAREKSYLKQYYVITGRNALTGSLSSSSGLLSMQFKPRDERGEEKDVFKIMKALEVEFKEKIKDATVMLNMAPAIRGFGNVSGFEFMLQDYSNGSPDRLDNVTKEFLTALNAREEIGRAFTTYAANYPQYEIVADEDKAAQYGVSLNNLMETLQIYFGSSIVTDFNRFGKYYRVIAQADVQYRTNPSSFDNIFVKNNKAEMIPVNSLIELKRVYKPEFLQRTNMFLAVQINGSPADGYSTGDAMRAIRETAENILPRSFGYEWTSLSREESSAGSQFIIIFIMSLVFVYFILSAQYESFILPLAVTLTIPVGILGVMLFINLFGIDNNIYVQVSMIMLIGLLAKNAILIVEYAIQRRNAGMSITEAAINAARLRLRPILMTSLTFAVGVFPLILSNGVGTANGNRSIGVSSVGGMLVGVFLGVIIIPVLFIIFQTIQEKIKSKRKEDDTTITESV
jgi:HAE1 family hydrophobic/amphiphilic exporter-1